jgi:hypothetical protein
MRVRWWMCHGNLETAGFEVSLGGHIPDACHARCARDIDGFGV